MSKLIALGFTLVLLVHNVASLDYGVALTKSLLYYEAQRSGRLPPSQRAQWRGDSGLNDGKDAGIDLTGGYYDAGDNVKFGFPMAFTMTMLAWSVVEFGPHFRAKYEVRHALDAIKWGTDYLIKAHPYPNVLYGQVGEAGADHACWQRPEDMTTPRTVYKIDEQHPGADLAGETAAAFAAASLAFKRLNPAYSSVLLNHAKQLYDFAKNHPGLYQNSIPDVGQFYSSSGYEDELLWASAWMARATNDNSYVDFVNKSVSSGGTRQMFSWDDKYIGAQVLITQRILQGKLPGNRNMAQFRNDAEQFICNCIQKGTSNAMRSKGGLLWYSEWDNLQYVTSASFIITAYADILSATRNTIKCSGGPVDTKELIDFARSQVDYILGNNPKGMSYMVGFGTNYPQQPHHRGASIPSIKTSPQHVDCKEGFGKWRDRQASNPNVLHGAIVGGPDQNDQYPDSRGNYQKAEPATANVAPLVGLLARLA